MSTIVSSNNNDLCTSQPTIVVPCHAAPLPTNDNEPRVHHNELLLGDAFSAEHDETGHHSGNPAHLTMLEEALMYDEVMDGLSDDETECHSPVRYDRYFTHDHNPILAPTSCTSLANHSPESFHGDSNEHVGNEAYFYENDNQDDERSDYGSVDSMVDIDDRTYEHLFEELTVVAVDDYNNSYYAAAPPLALANTTISACCAREGELITTVGENLLTTEENNFSTHTIAQNEGVEGQPYQNSSPHPFISHPEVPSRHFYTRAADTRSSYYYPRPHTQTHTHTARNTSLLKSANEKYFSKTGHLGWQWGLVIGNSTEELEEEKVWLNSIDSKGQAGRDSCSYYSADAVPCQDCCLCGCNSPLEISSYVEYDMLLNAASNTFVPSSGAENDFIPHPHNLQQNPYFASQTPEVIPLDMARQVRFNNYASNRNSVNRRQPLTKTEKIAARSGLSLEECEVRFPYYCGLKKFPTLPIRPTFPAEALSVPFVKCCYYGQRPHKECSMGTKCYHTHDDEDGDKVPEAFPDGKNRNERRSSTVNSKVTKLSFAAIAAAAATTAALKLDGHVKDHTISPPGSEIATVPQSICGDDCDDDARTTAGRGIYSANPFKGPSSHPPVVTRAQLAAVPCQYGARCAIPHHAATAKHCGFNDVKLKRYKEYLAELREYDGLLAVYRKAKAEVRSEAAMLQSLEATLQEAAAREMKHLMPGREKVFEKHSSSALKSEFTLNISAKDFTPSQKNGSVSKEGQSTSETLMLDSHQPTTVDPHAADPQNLAPRNATNTLLSSYQSAMPCLHCGQIGSVTLRSVPMFRPNKHYDGYYDKRREVRMHGVGASCGRCNKTFAFDDEDKMHAYLLASGQHPKYPNEACPMPQQSQIFNPDQGFERESTTAFLEPPPSKLVDANSLNYVEDLPW